MNRFTIVRARLLTIAGVCATFVGCGMPSDQEGTNARSPDYSELQKLDRDLAVGATGPSVRALHEYLEQFGYFPSRELSRKYPAWRPIVPSAPTDMNVYDEQTVAAVRGFQTVARVTPTGIVDEETRSMLKKRRCSIPDGILGLDPANKFAYQGSRWGSTSTDHVNITWRLLNTDDVTITQARTAFTAAFATWAAQTNRTFQELTSGTPDIQLNFAAIDGPDKKLANSTFPNGGGDTTYDTGETWSVATPTPGGATDLETIALHEVGHTLGLDHSSISNAVTMWPFAAATGTQDRTLNVDDNVAISTVYDIISPLPGAAQDIGVGADGSVWVIGAAAGDGGVYKLNAAGTGWNQSAGFAARIAVEPSGIPWVVTTGGDTYRRTTNDPTTGTWVLMPLVGAFARDIGVGSDGSVWAIDKGLTSDGLIYKYNGTNWTLTSDFGYAARIAVGPTGVPWVVNSSGDSFRRTTNSPSSGSWTALPSVGSNAKLLDIGIGEGSYAWVVSQLKLAPQFVSLKVLNEQVEILHPMTGAVLAPARFEYRNTWQTIGLGTSGAVSVGPNSRPYSVNPDGSIYTVTK